jgi:hypothetical protein
MSDSGSRRRPKPTLEISLRVPPIFQLCEQGTEWSEEGKRPNGVEAYENPKDLAKVADDRVCLCGAGGSGRGDVGELLPIRVAGRAKRG